MRLPLVLALVIGLACEGFCVTPRMYRYSTDYYKLCWGGTCGVRAETFRITSWGDSILLSIRPPVSTTYDGLPAIGDPILSNAYLEDPLANASLNMRINQYEESDCGTLDGRLFGPTNNLRYVYTGVFARQMYCRYYTGDYFICRWSWQSSSPADGLLETHGQAVGATGLSDPKKAYSATCTDRSYIGNPPTTILIKVSDDTAIQTDTCLNNNQRSCNVCSWPYLSMPDPSACGCVVDRTRYQDAATLAARVYLYCQTYSDGSGAQYYYDASRSCLNSSVCGIPKGACSSPQTGKTIYMPVQHCPNVAVATGYGSDTVSAPDSLGQPAVYNPADGPSTGGTGSGLDSGGVYSRLDTIIGLLRRGGTGGSDTSLRTYLDTVGSGRSDPLDSVFGGYVDSLMGTGDSIQGSVSELTGVVGDHTSRGDTSGIGGYTLDSLIDVCFTIHDSAYCLRDAGAGWTFMRTAAYWIRRLILVLWGFVCAYMFYIIAKDQ